MSSYAVVPADLAKDRHAIVDVWSRNLGSHSREAHEAKFDWYYRSNPLGPGRCWVLKTASGEIVGTSGLGLRQVWVGDRSALVGVASDLAVDAQHRSLLPATMLQRAVLAEAEKDLALIYGIPNKKSAPLFKRLGYEVRAEPRRYVKVLRSGKFLRSNLRLPGIAAGAAASLIDPIMRVASKETWHGRGEYQVRKLGGFDSRIDDLWRRVRSPGALATDRSAEFFRWRFTASPLRTYSAVGLFAGGAGRDERLGGYSVVSTVDAGQVRVLDLQGESPQVLAITLGAAIGWARAEKGSTISCEVLEGDELEAVLLSFGFRLRPQFRPLSVYVPPARRGTVPTTWRFRTLDEDFD